MSKSKELATTTELVLQILKNEPVARNNDNFLYLQVLRATGQKNGVDIDSMSIPRFFCHLKEYGFPAFETVRRTRQKIQSEYPELSANSTVSAGRMLNEEIFRDYARGNV